MHNKMIKRKGISTSIIRADIEKLNFLPDAELYEFTFFKPEDIEILKRFILERKKPFGVHLPFVFRYAQLHPHPTTLDDKLRKDTYDVNIKSALFARELGAEYVLLHFPSAKQKESWRKNVGLVEEVISHLDELNNILSVRIENVYMNDDFHSAFDYLYILKEIGCTMCVDVGHLLLDSEIYEFNPVNFIEVLSDYISEFHIYYADMETYTKCHHAPWGDSEKFQELLRVIKDFNVDFVIEPSNDCPERLQQLMSFWEGI
ncbi:sugar phosphate isomerase/epimerase family protein [Fervidobacterium sp.]